MVNWMVWKYVFEIVKWVFGYKVLLVLSGLVSYFVMVQMFGGYNGIEYVVFGKICFFNLVVVYSFVVKWGVWKGGDWMEGGKVYIYVVCIG